MIVSRNYENLRVLHENTMPPRSYYIPASKRMSDLIEHREKSDRIQFLNGTWKFKYFDSIYDVKENFYEMGYDVSSYDEIHVPGVWQMAGYDNHQYTNIKYPFPFDPPFVPQDIPCGAYVTNFTYEKDQNASKAFLNFEGVDSCFYVWVNGKYVGYSQVPHATSEFDITDLLVEGDNTMAVLVLKWCDGSYLEDQDKFRMSGIFRDVYILKRPENRVTDYRIKTKVEGQTARVSVDVEFSGESEATIILEYENGTTVAADTIDANGKVEFEVMKPILWNTERPYLYSCTSFGTKVGGGLGTAIAGWLLAASGYVQNAVTQSQSCVNMLHIMYLWLPMIFNLCITFILIKLNVEKANKELEEKTA